MEHPLKDHGTHFQCQSQKANNGGCCACNNHCWLGIPGNSPEEAKKPPINFNLNETMQSARGDIKKPPVVEVKHFLDYRNDRWDFLEPRMKEDLLKDMTAEMLNSHADKIAALEKRVEELDHKEHKKVCDATGCSYCGKY